MSDKNLLSMLNPRPAAEIEKELHELRASDNFTDIKKFSRAPKGKFCNNCENLTEKYEPRICSWNGETTDYVSSPFCSFFNSKLAEDDNSDCCNKPCLKCFACLMQTGGKIEE